MQSKIIYVIIIIIGLLSNRSYGKEWISTKDTVSLVGKLSVHHYKTVNGKLEKVFILQLNKSINVDQDNYGKKVKNVHSIQAFFSDNILYPGAFNEKIKLGEEYFKNEVIVTGILHHQITSHHYRKIIIEIINIVIK
jgi:hypothetical protein